MSGAGLAASKPDRHAGLTWEIPAPLGPELQTAVVPDAFRPAGRQHLEAIAKQLARAAGFELPDGWAPILASLATRAIACLSPTAMTAHGDIEPRSYLKVKRLLGDLSESSVVDGIAFRKNVAHKRMPTHVVQPRIAIVGGAIQAAPSAESLSSFDTLLDKEQKQLEQIVQHIVSLNPHVLLVGKAVPRAAQDMLLKHGIALMLNVKSGVLARIATCTGAEVVPTAEELSTRSIGFCKEFLVTEGLPANASSEAGAEQFAFSALDGGAAAGGQAASIAIFSGCPRPLGATVLLHGPDSNLMALLKRLLLHLAKAAHMQRLEDAFFADEMPCALARAGEDEAVVLCPDPEATVTRASSEAARLAAEDRGDAAITSSSPYVSNFLEQGARGERVEDLVEAEGPLGEVSEAPNEAPSPAERMDRVASAMYRLWLTISCKNPSKGLLCEPAHRHCMHMYNSEDLTLRDFLADAAPPSVRCFQPNCRDGAVLHLRSFMRGNSLITLSCARLSASKRLNDNRVWHWLRPSSSTETEIPVRRVALSPDSTCMTFAHLLSLLLDIRHADLAGFDVQKDFIRYIASADVVICLHHSKVVPMTVCFPPDKITATCQLQSAMASEVLTALTEEYDTMVSAVERIVDVRVAGMEEARAARWRAALEDTKETSMSLIRQLQTEIKQVGVQPGGRDVAALVWRINKLRRALAWVGSKWAFLLDERRTPPPELRSPEPGELPLEVEGPARSADASGTATPSEASKKAPPSAGDGSIGKLMATEVGVQGSSEGTKLSAPSLRADMAGAQEAGAEDAVPDEDGSAPAPEGRKLRLIPTGLVARYVAMFQENASQTQHSWRGPDWATSIRTRTGEKDGDERPSSTANFEISSQGKMDAKSETSESSVKRFADLASTLDELQEAESQDEGQTPDATAGDLLAKIPRLSSVISGRAQLPGGVSGIQITVFDQEPTSIVAYALSTGAYHDYIKSVNAAAEERQLEGVGEEAPQTGSAEASGPGSAHEGFDETARHCHFSFRDSQEGDTVEFQVTVYFAPQFHAFRNMVVQGAESEFLASISRCRRWYSKGGKSNVYFAKTIDDRFIVKQLSKAEKQFILHFAPAYLEYLTAARAHGQESCLTRIVGLFQVSVQYLSRDSSASVFGTRDNVLDLMVMENIFYDRRIDRVYDLKGSERDRYAEDDPRQSGTVLLDENLKELSLSSPIVVGPVNYSRLQRAIWSDTEFLTNLGVMDYSLLIGLDKKHSELVVGIIDFIRQFTLDKALEMYVKKAGILGGGGKDPTVLSPRHYSGRFRAAMNTWLTAVPEGATAIEEYSSSI